MWYFILLWHLVHMCLCVAQSHSESNLLPGRHLSIYNQCLGVGPQFSKYWKNSWLLISSLSIGSIYWRIMETLSYGQNNGYDHGYDHGYNYDRVHDLHELTKSSPFHLPKVVHHRHCHNFLDLKRVPFDHFLNTLPILLSFNFCSIKDKYF